MMTDRTAGMVAPIEAEHVWRRYTVGVLLAVLAMLLRVALRPFLQDEHPYVLPLLAVTAAAWYGGFGPAIVCLGISLIAAVWFVVPPDDSLRLDGIASRLGLTLSAFGGLACALLGQTQRRARTELLAQLRASTAQRRELEAEVQRRAAAEAVSHEARQFLESTLNALRKHIAVLDENGTILEVNEAWRRFARECGDGELRPGIGANYLAACDRLEGSAGEPSPAVGIRGVLAGESGRFLQEYPCFTGDQERWFIVSANRFMVGEFARVVVAHDDITARKIAENAVRDREERFRVLAEMIPQLVWRTSSHGVIEYYNPQWYRYTGQDTAQAIGGEWLDAVHPDDRRRTAEEWTRAVACAGTFAIECRLRGADATYRWFLVRAEPHRDPAGRITYWFGSCTDVDDQRRYAEHLERAVHERTAELEALNAELRRSNEDLDTFAYIASHDLQEPLRKIQAFGGRLGGRYRDKLEGQGVEYLDRMLASAGRMRRLIDDLLSFARVTSKARSFIPTDLGTVVADAAADLDDRLAQSGGRVDVGPLPTLDADPSQIRQVFHNLLVNALKFQRPGVPPVVGISAAVEPSATGGVCEVTVADNGIGFEPEYRDRIFELFQRLHGRDEYEGTGLGLAICRKIVERHGGAIRADGRPGHGAMFTIRLPVHQPRGEA